ncbi:MAG: ATP-binding protein [Negativicutes bacterium]|nr:ATP-binding protein [Negativicutes bacterium]
MFLEYNNPSSIIGYSNDFTKYTDVAINLIIVLVTNSAAFGLFMKFYIKEQHKAREYLLQVEQQKMDSALSRFDRLNLIGEIAASIGHEVRNPMTTVRGYLQLYQKKYQQHEEQFDLMINEIDRANAIITEFLSLAKNKRVDLKLGNLNTTITNLFPLLQADAFRTGHYLNLETSDVPDVLFDDNEIRQLLLNLFRNALEATPERCTITIATKVDYQCVHLSVRDTGPGLPDLVLQNIGKPFVTTKETGTGLGLPVCYSIAKRHNAEIDVETGAGGTTFMVKFNLPS